MAETEYEARRRIEGEYQEKLGRDRAARNSDHPQLLTIINELHSAGVVSDQVRQMYIKSVNDGNITSMGELEERLARGLDSSGSRLTGGITRQEATPRAVLVFERNGHTASESLTSQAEPSNWDTWKASVGDYFTVDDDERANMEYKKEMARSLRSSNQIPRDKWTGIWAEAIDANGSMADFEKKLREVGVNEVAMEEVREIAVHATTVKENTTQRHYIDRVELEKQRGDYIRSPQATENLTKLKEFESLEEQFPSKYKFDEDSKTIFVWATDDLAGTEGWVPLDEQGNPKAAIDMTIEEFDVSRRWSGDVPEWIRMTQETGQNVSEEDYFDLLHVVENPNLYGADPSRYLPGMPDFLGGFGSQHQVERTISTPRMEDWNRMGITDQYEARFLSGQPGVGNRFSDVTSQVNRPWYDDNDQWALFAGLSPEDVMSIQRQMVDVGAMDAEDVAWGYWGGADADAMQDWLTLANGRAEKWTDTPVKLLKEHYEYLSSLSGTTSQATYAAPSYQTLDPAQANQTIKAVIRQQLGREPTEDELASLGEDLSQHHRDAFVADVEAERMQFAARQAEETTTADTQDVDFESRFMENFEAGHEPEIESVRQGEQLQQRQQSVGGSLDNIMRRLGGGIG